MRGASSVFASIHENRPPILKRRKWIPRIVENGSSGSVITDRTGDAARDALRGNSPPQEAYQSRSRGHTSEHSVLPREVEEATFGLFILEFLAEQFGPDLGEEPEVHTASQHDMILGAGSKFDNPEEDETDEETTAIVTAHDNALSEPPSAESAKDHEASNDRNITLKTNNAQDVSMSIETSTLPHHANLLDVREQLMGLLQSNSKFNSASDSYLCDFHVWQFFNEGLVSQLLNHCGERSPNEKEVAAQRICSLPSSKKDTKFRSFRKIFAILILIKQEQRIYDFLNYELDDSTLPLTKIGKDSAPYHLAAYKADQRSHHRVFRGWGSSDVKAFDDWQWQLSAPFFKKEENGKCLHYRFTDRVVLPFSNIIELGSKGAFGRVYKLDIDPRHHSLLDSSEPIQHGGKQLFAVKKLNASNRDMFLAESHVLARINGIAARNPSITAHLAKLLATFEIASDIDTTYFFIFPCADSNFREFWNASPGIRSQAEIGRLAEWLAGQYHGLAEALHVIHRYDLFRSPSDQGSRNRGFHGDIKPENILFFNDKHSGSTELGVLQLADFGLARYHHSTTILEVSPRVTGHPYCPPEVDLTWKTDSSLDIWTLGCLFLESLVWLMFGCEGLDQFKEDRRTEGIIGPALQARPFYKVKERWGKACIQLNDGLVKWIKKLHADERTTQFIHDLLDLIPTEMIVLEDKSREVKLQEGEQAPKHPGLWKSTTNKRSSSKDLVDKLKSLTGRDDEYFSKPAMYGAKIKGLKQTLQTSKSTAKFRQEGRAKAESRKEERKREIERDKRRRELRRLKGQGETESTSTEQPSFDHSDNIGHTDE